MPKRPVFYPELGAYFRSLRDAKGWDQSHAANIAARRKIDLSYQQLRWLEEGKTKNPAEALRAIAALYTVPFEEVLAAFIRHRFGLTISVTTTATESAPFSPVHGPSADALSDVKDSATNLSPPAVQGSGDGSHRQVSPATAAIDGKGAIAPNQLSAIFLRAAEKTQRATTRSLLADIGWCLREAGRDSGDRVAAAPARASKRRRRGGHRRTG